MSAFARTEASGLLVHQGHLAEGCRGLAATVDAWFRAGEWAQQWHTLSRCVIALDRIGQPRLAAEVVGAIESHSTIGGPPVLTTLLRDLVFVTRDSIVRQLGVDQARELRARGATAPIAAIVERTRSALRGVADS
jgi:hypothetical protein